MDVEASRRGEDEPDPRHRPEARIAEIEVGRVRAMLCNAAVDGEQVEL